MIDYHDYLPQSEIDWNTNHWLSEGVSQERIDKWLTNQARIVKGQRDKASGNDTMKGGATFMGGAMLTIAFIMLLVFMITLFV